MDATGLVVFLLVPLITAQSSNISLMLCNSTSTFANRNVAGHIVLPSYLLIGSTRDIMPSSPCELNVLVPAGCRLGLKRDTYSSDNKCHLRENVNGRICAFNPELCDSFYLSENGYSDDVIPAIAWPIFSNLGERIFMSQTRNVRINFCPEQYRVDSKSMSLQISVPFRVLCSDDESTTKRIYGKSSEVGTVSSLGFPYSYETNNDVFTYTLINRDDGYIRLSFDDWSLHPRSKIQIFLNGSQSPYHEAVGVHARPFVTSSNSVLTFKFYTASVNKTQYHFPYFGFTARYEFLSPNSTRSWPDMPSRVTEQYFYSVFGASLQMTCQYTPQNAWVDYIWVITRSEVHHPNAYLVLRLGQMTILDHKGEYLEVRNGNSSLASLMDISVRQAEIVLPSGSQGMYVRLKQQCSSSQRLFTATFVWVNPGQSEPGNAPSRCLNNTDFQCLRDGRCISSSLVCDGINNCGDNSDERTQCPTRRPDRPSCKPFDCPTMGSICLEQVCDGKEDCSDGSDEQYCDVGTSTTTVDYETDMSNYSFLSIMMPLLMVCFITLIVSCIVLIYVLRKKRRQMAITRARLAQREQMHHSLISDASLGGMDINGDLSYGLLHPPSYEDTILFSNEGFASREPLPQPPPYAAVEKPEDQLVEPSLLPPSYNTTIMDQTGGSSADNFSSGANV